MHHKVCRPVSPVLPFFTRYSDSCAYSFTGNGTELRNSSDSDINLGADAVPEHTMTPTIRPRRCRARARAGPTLRRACHARAIGTFRQALKTHAEPIEPLPLTSHE